MENLEHGARIYLQDSGKPLQAFLADLYFRKITLEVR